MYTYIYIYIYIYIREDCRTASKRSFDLLKCDIYNKDLSY